MTSLRAAGLLLAAALVLGGCSEPTPPAAAPTPGSTASGSATPGAAPGAQPLRIDADPAGSDGLTVRYRGADGGIETLPVEAFRR